MVKPDAPPTTRRIQSLELNPVIVGASDLTVLAAHARLGPPSAAATPDRAASADLKATPTDTLRNVQQLESGFTPERW